VERIISIIEIRITSYRHIIQLHHF